MKFSTLKIKRENTIFWGVIILGVLFLTIILGDSYILYKSTQLRRGIMPETAVIPIISVQEIDEATKILDEREQKFKEMVNFVTR